MHNKIFLSYTHVDDADKDSQGNGWVTNFRNSLIQIYNKIFIEKIEIFIDHKKVWQGSDWKFKIDKEISDSDIFIAFISKNYVESEFCRYEWNYYIYTAHQKSRGGEGILPIYYVEVPGWDNSSIDIDFENKYNSKEAVEFLKKNKEIFHAIQLSKDGEKIKLHDTFLDLRNWNKKGPGYLLEINLIKQLDQLKFLQNEHIDEDSKLAAKLAGIGKEIFIRIKKINLGNNALSNITNPDPHFIGRYKQLLEIHKTLMADNHGTICSLNAFGGMGKTAIALQYAHAYKDCYATGGVWFVDCENLSSFDVILFKAYDKIYASQANDKLAKIELRAAGSFIDSDNKIDLQGIIKELQNFCLQRTKTLKAKLSNIEIEPSVLLILDNLTENTILAQRILDRIPNERWFNLLITTRLRKEDIAKSKVKSINEIDYLNDDEAFEIFKSYFIKTRNENESKLFYSEVYQNSLKELITFLAGYPLAVVLCGAHLGNNHFTNPKELLKELGQDGLEINKLIEDSEDVHQPGDRTAMDSKVHTLNGIVKFSIDKILQPGKSVTVEIGELSILILKYSIFLHNEYINISWIEGWIINFNETLFKNTKNSELLFKKAFALLHEYQILRVHPSEDKAAFRKMHQLVQMEFRKQFFSISQDEMISILKSVYFDSKINEREYFLTRIWDKEGEKYFSFINSCEVIKYALEYDILVDNDIRSILGFVAPDEIKNLAQGFSTIHKSVESVFDAFSIYYEIRKDLFNSPLSKNMDEFYKQVSLYADGLRIKIKSFDFENDRYSEEYIKIINHYIDCCSGSIELIKQNAEEIKKAGLEMGFIRVQDNLCFDQMDCYLRLAQYEGEVNKDLHKAIEILDEKIISEFDPFFKYNPAARLLMTSIYHSLQQAKAQKGNYLIGIGKGKEGNEILIEDVPERLQAIERNLKYDFNVNTYKALIQIAESYLTNQDYTNAYIIYERVKELLPKLKEVTNDDFYALSSWQIRLKSTISSTLNNTTSSQGCYDSFNDLLDEFMNDLSEHNIKEIIKGHYPYSLLSFTPSFFKDIQFNDSISINKSTGKFEFGNNSKLFRIKITDFYLKVYYSSIEEPVNWIDKINCCNSYLLIMKFMKDEEHILEHALEFYQIIPEQYLDVENKYIYNSDGVMSLLISIMDSAWHLEQRKIFKDSFNLFEQKLGIIYNKYKASASGDAVRIINFYIATHKHFKKLIEDEINKSQEASTKDTGNNATGVNEKKGFWKKFFG